MDAQSTAASAAKKFVEEETDFHLGDLITEQSHLVTRDLSTRTQADTRDGISLLLQVDRDILPVSQSIIQSGEFDQLVEKIVETVKQNGRVIFSSCGASGRLAIILESMWREFWFGQTPENQVLSVMTGGERALIRSVENFEDYQSFGRRQAQEAHINSKDLLIALTEGGEISSVIGTIKESLAQQTPVFMLFNNPKKLLINKFQRSREVLSHPGVILMELTTGPMALSGSTRMQATTIGMLVVGMALEEAFATLKSTSAPIRQDGLLAFQKLLNQLSTGLALEGLVAFTDLEYCTYKDQGRVSYLAEGFLLDVFADTTERTPTFMIPPFKIRGDQTAPEPWVIAQDPNRSSEAAWLRMLKREPRGLDWDLQDYQEMGAQQSILDSLPRLTQKDILAYPIGNEAQPARQRKQDLYLPVFVDKSFDLLPGWVGEARCIPVQIGSIEAIETPSILIPLDLWPTGISLFEHLAIKLIFNTVSTATMAKLGRISGNWMIQVDATNKKLIDRATRIVQHFTGLSYEQSCYELFKTMEDGEIDRKAFKESFVSQTLKRLGVHLEK